MDGKRNGFRGILSFIAEQNLKYIHEKNLLNGNSFSVGGVPQYSRSNS